MDEEETGRRVPTSVTTLDVQLGGETTLAPRPPGRRTRRDVTRCISNFGLVRPSFVVLLGDPGVGKTSLLWQIVRNMSGDCKSILCVSDAFRVDSEVRALVKVLPAESTRSLRVRQSLKRNQPSVLVLDGLEAMWRNEPLPRSSGAAAGWGRADKRLAFVCATARDLAHEFNLCVIAAASRTKSWKLSRPINHVPDAVIEVTRDGMTRMGSTLSFKAIKNRFSRVA